MKTAEYDFFLPAELIASRPLPERDESRLLVLRRDGRIEHRRFFELHNFLDPGDMLILNNSKVFPARITGYKPTGGRLEILLVREVVPGLWDIVARERYTGHLTISDDLTVQISEGGRAFFEHRSDLMKLIRQVGKMPLPPYIKRPSDDEDRERYQTVYAEKEGSIAAPTAGLHFTQKVIETLAVKSVLVRFITLHVGIGTFRPVKTDELEDHSMEKEFFEIDPGLAQEIEEVKRRGNKVVSVGTTTTRALEGYLSGRCTIVCSNGTIKGWTDIFIYEGYAFKAVDSLITNFHLPRSTPLMLASVIAGRYRLLEAYKEAISMRYRFFSYGDAMLAL
jgi:S-adenosylmethionine:tRNA ribosyltransferase-isomerase